MSVLERIAYLQDRKDEVPNQELARELVKNKDLAGIKEIADNIFNKDKNIKSDCIKVLYEIGYICPEMVTEYTEDFMKLLKSSNNRLVWGAMIALSLVAELKADLIYENLEMIYLTMKQGSVITIDNGIKVLAKVASKSDKYNNIIFPYLINHLKTCRPKEVAQHAESILIAVNFKNKIEYIKTLEERENSLTLSQLARVKKLYKTLSK